MSSSVSSSRFMFDDLDLERYDDAPFDDHSVNVAVSALTRIGVIRGNDDGTFRPDRRLNRAEFITIVMRLLDDNNPTNTNCFPDIKTSDWFAEDVCRAKALGIVRGNAQAGVPESMWRFEPTRDVQYEEAVKVLAKIYAMPINGDEEGADWYVPFLKAAADLGIDLNGLKAGDTITRGEMARLTIGFTAQSEGELDALRDAEIEEEDRSSSSRTSSRSSTSSTSSRRSSSSRSSSLSERGSGTFDPLTDTDVRSSILVLGETSPILAAVKFFSNGEPVEVTEVSVRLTGNVDSVSSVLIYNADSELLGTATGGGSAQIFTANIPAQRFYLPYREDRAMYVRARTKTDDQGGRSGEDIEVSSISLEGTGVWSNDDYSTTSSDDFPANETAFGVLTSVTNTGVVNSVLISGTERLLGQFRFVARAPESTKDVRLLTLAFDIEQAGGITLSNVRVRTNDGSSEESSCTVSASTVTCSSIPANIGTVDTERVIRVYGDVTVPSTSGNKSLRLVLNDPGTPSNAGDVTWTDGETTFNWLPFEQPVVRGTLFEG